MNTKQISAGIAVVAVFAVAMLAVVPVGAQAPVTGSADPESLFTSPDPKLHANKQVVLHIMRDLLETNHWDQADKYLTKAYIQHNPNVASGLEPVLKFFGSRTPTPIPDRRSWKTRVVSVTAEGDLVVVAIVRVYPDPRSPGRMTRPGSTCGGLRTEGRRTLDGATIVPPAPRQGDTLADGA